MPYDDFFNAFESRQATNSKKNTKIHTKICIKNLCAEQVDLIRNDCSMFCR